MRKITLALVVVLATAVGAFAGVCQQETLDNYVVAGFSCTIADQTYADFTYSGTSVPSGFAIGAGSVMAIPQTTPYPGFLFSAPWAVSTSSGILSLDSFFDYTITSVAPMTDILLSISGVTFTGTGSITVGEQACLGAMLPSCTGGTVVNLSVYASSSGTLLTDQVNFAGVNFIDVNKDLTVTAGTNGSASVSGLYDEYSEGSVPEPGTLSMLGVGVVAVAGFVRRKLSL